MPEARYLRRSDGRLEQVCEHGVGHTVAIDRVPWVKWNDPKSIHAWWVHGCDGCCEFYEKIGRVE